jgi:site-specific recombinase XerD
MMPTDAEFREAIAKEMKRKKTNGVDTFCRLDTISSMLDGRPLGALSTEHKFTSRILAEHFKSSFAHALHIKAVMHVLRCLSVGSQVQPEAQEHWRAALAKAEIETKAVEVEIKKWFPQETQGVEVPTTSAGKEKDSATPETIKKYVRDLMQMMGKLNVQSLSQVVTKPEQFIEELRSKCTSEGTLKNHISTILCIFKYNPKMKETHPQAFERWSLASAEQRKRTIKESRMNAPSNSRQAENFVPMIEWQEALGHLMKDEEPHSSLEKSQALVFLSYACSMPPKRSDLGSVKIFRSEPSETECKDHPNHIVLLNESQGRMVIAEHKTAKFYEPIVEELPVDFHRVLKESLRNHPRHFLFENSKGEAFTPQCFSKWVIRKTKDIFGDKAPGISLLRHAYCTALDLNQLTGLQQDEVAARMGHSTARQMEYRFVNEKPIHDYCRGFRRP